MKHELKILDRFYNQIISWEKTFEIRFNDRWFQKWDLIQLKEISSMTTWYINNEMLLEITNVFQEKWFWLQEWYCILSFKKI